MKLPSVALAVFLVSVSAVSAAVVSLDFRNAPSNVFSSRGVTVTATAHAMDGGFSFGPQVALVLASNGPGVRSARVDSDLVDGQDANEIVRFAFSQAVRIVSVTLSDADDEDTVSLGFQDNLGHQRAASAQGLGAGSTT